MGMYLELSRPDGDVSRWEKVLKRLILLNKNYPLKGKDCGDIDFQRDFDKRDEDTSIIYTTIRDSFIDQGVIFFGGFANILYSRYLPFKQRKHLRQIPDFDILSDDPIIAADIIKERLHDEGVKKISIVKRAGIGEIISDHYEIRVNKETIAFIYKPLACHSYNKIKLHGRSVNIATIDTMLSFYLAFLYADRAYYDPDRILCMAQYLFQVQHKNRLQQKGLLKRFSLTCYGEQDTIESIRAEKTEKFKELKDKKNTREYEEWFLRYTPGEKSSTPTKKNQTKKRKNRPKKKKTRKTGLRRLLQF